MWIELLAFGEGTLIKEAEAYLDIDIILKAEMEVNEKLKSSDIIIAVSSIKYRTENDIYFLRGAVMTFCVGNYYLLPLSGF
mmetsp:Transcript_14645/g.17829  ORF Transcript_14645/g.17829 Transcript_14645/m.17829 type:complete len:81 (-) Transcript_14645:86-328(-)